MDRNKLKNVRRSRRRKGIRKRVIGHAGQPRLAVFRSNKHIYAQLIDDLAGCTLAAASSKDADGDGDGGNSKGATSVGKRLAERAKSKGIESVTFDRGGYLFHGRVKALADGAREGGLKF